MATAGDITRVEAIAAYDLIGAPPLLDLEGLVQLASTVCGVSTAVINIIDDRFQHQVASVGFVGGTCAREDSMCAVVFQQPGVVVVEDARLDERFAANPFVTGEIANVRFYASSPVVTPSGIPIGTLCVFDENTGDLTPEHRRALDLLAHQVVDVLELRRITRTLGESNEQLERFAGRVSHDLRNPLTALTGFIELAADSPELANAPRPAGLLARAESAAGRMAAMLGDLLEYARIGGSRPRRASVDLEGVAHAVLEDLHAVRQETPSTIEIDAAVEVIGDVTLLRALLQNLVANAIKFTSPTGVSPHIQIRAQESDDLWRITVDDNGPGIPVESRDRVFGLMERGASEEVPGLGIGLSACLSIVQGHGGRIGIDDSPLGGTRIWIELPRATPDTATQTH